MGYKKVKNNLGFADFALISSLQHNRSLKLMDKLNSSLNWHRIESVLMNHYTVGTSGQGADAYSPLLFFNCTVYSRHCKKPVEKVYAGKPNRDFFALNNIADGIMRKDSTTAKLTEYEIERNKKISKSDILWSSTSALAICTMKPKKPGLQLLLRTNSISGAVKLPIISDRSLSFDLEALDRLSG